MTSEGATKIYEDALKGLMRANKIAREYDLEHIKYLIARCRKLDAEVIKLERAQYSVSYSDVEDTGMAPEISKHSCRFCGQ